MDAQFELHRNDVGEWRWRLRRPDGEVVALSVRGYLDKDDALAAIHDVKTLAAKAQTKET